MKLKKQLGSLMDVRFLKGWHCVAIQGWIHIGVGGKSPEKEYTLTAKSLKIATDGGVEVVVEKYVLYKFLWYPLTKSRACHPSPPHPGVPSTEKRIILRGHSLPTTTAIRRSLRCKV